MTRFVIGDIHGRIEALNEVLELSGFDSKNDLLIVLGDVVDGGANTYEVVEVLLDLNTKLILGNHDVWFKEWYESNCEFALPAWVHQGGYATMKSYDYSMPPFEHRQYFNSGLYYYVDHNNNLFVHGGFNPRLSIQDNPVDTLLWDRRLINSKNYIEEYSKIFVGHTTTQYFGSEEPIFNHNIIMVDTGAGWTGKLTIMNVDDTTEWYQSKSQNKNVR